MPRVQRAPAQSTATTRRAQGQYDDAADENVPPTNKKQRNVNNKGYDSTPVKLTSRQTPDVPTTPFTSPNTILHKQHTPKTPAMTKAMMTKLQSMTKPIRETDSLQLIELAAFKVDATAYNSYLYTGKMKVPLTSNIAREDYATLIGAQQQRNICTTNAITQRLQFEDDDDQHNDTGNSGSNSNSTNTNTKATTTKNKKGAKKGKQVVDIDHENNSHLSDSSFELASLHDSDWQFHLDDDDDKEVDAAGTHRLRHDTDDDDDDDDDVDIPLTGKRTTRGTATTGKPTKAMSAATRRHRTTSQQQQSSTQNSQTHHPSGYSLRTRRQTSMITPPAATATPPTPPLKTATSSVGLVSKTSTVVQQPDPILSQQGMLTRRGTLILNDNITKPHINNNIEPLLLTPGIHGISHGKDSHHNIINEYGIQHGMTVTKSSSLSSSTQSTYNITTSLPSDQYTIIPIVVKYPLMGSLDDWRDSFQTCSEEVVMYRQIQTWKCPYLLRYYGTHGPGIVFEYVDGESLDHYLNEPEVDIEQQTWLWSELGLHITTAILYLHKLGISHNDLKPENVRYSASKKIWKLLDLGLATDFEMKVSRSIGTDGYRSPEVVETCHVNRKSDVYGLGVMMSDAYECLSKRYAVMESIYNDYQYYLDQYQSELESGEYPSDGEIDLAAEAINVLDEHIKRRNKTNTPIDNTNSEIMIHACQSYMEFKDLVSTAIDLMTKHDYVQRPSIKRLLHFFRNLMQREAEIQAAHATLRSMGIY